MTRRDWHEILKSWAKPPSETEEEKGANAARMIREALRSYPQLRQRNFEVYATGSYRNNTNVRLASDIDIAAVLLDAVYNEFPDSGPPTSEMLGFRAASYGLNHFRADIGAALRLHFGHGGVTEGAKAFNIHENTYRLDADVTPFCEHRLYTGKMGADGRWEYIRGAEMRPPGEPAKRVINWHNQHYEQGVARNDATRRRFKRIVRILKRLRDDMLDCGDSVGRAAAGAVPSFLLECLVYNAPDACFNIDGGGYYRDTMAVMRQLWSDTKPGGRCERFVEVSGLKMLFDFRQPWTREQAHEFLLRGWQHIGFE